MRKTLLIVTTAIALAGAAVTPAVAAPTVSAAAASGVAGPTASANACKQAQKKYVNAGYVVGACYKGKGGWYFAFKKK
jgi:hypothetical protein